MPSLEEIQAKADELQVALDAEQVQIADLLAAKDAANTALQATITGLNETVASLQAQLVDGGTAEQRQAVLDKLTATIADLQATVAP